MLLQEIRTKKGPSLKIPRIFQQRRVHISQRSPSSFWFSLGLGVVFLTLMVLIRASAAHAANPYYFSEEKPKISSSQLTGHYKTSAFSPNIEVGKITYLFPENAKRIYWLGKTDIQTRPYELYAVWYAPDGSEYDRQRCDWKGTSDYRTMLKLPRRKKEELLGQWRLEIEDAGRDVLRRERFYVGPALNVIDSNPAERWSHPEKSLEEAAAVLLNHDVEVRISRELGITKTVYKRLKILTAAGKSNNEFYESYKEKQFPRIKFAHSVLEDGTIQADAQQFPGVLQRVPPHHRSARVMFVRMLRAETGDVLEYEMTFDEPYVEGEDLIYDEFFTREAVPVLMARYTVIVPEDMDLRYHVYGTAQEPVVSPRSASGKKRLQWTWNSLPALAAEPAMPPYRDVADSVVIATARDWSDVAQEWRRHTVNKYKVNDELKGMLHRILLDSDTVKDKIAAIYKYVKYKVEYSGFDFGWANPEPVPSVATLKDKKGGAKDQAVLLKTFLNEAGISADVALVRTREAGPAKAETPGLGEFNHVMVVARDGEKKYFLDPSRPYYLGWRLPARDWGASALVIQEDAAELVTIPAQKDDGRQEIAADLEMGADFVVTGTLRVEYFGREDARIKNDLNAWDQNQTVAHVRDQVRAVVPAGNFTQVEVFNQKKIGRNARLEAQVQTTEPWISGNAPWTVRLTDPQAMRPDYLFENRQHAVHLIGLRRRRFVSRLKLPRSIQVKALPSAASAETPYFQYHVRFTRQEDVVTMEGAIEEKKEHISREDYPAFLKVYEEALSALASGITLVPAADAVADTENLTEPRDSVAVSPASASP